MAWSISIWGTRVRGTPMEPDAVTTLVGLLAIPAAAGASWAGVKAGLNGARQNIASIDKIVSRLDDKVNTMALDHGERLTTLEVETSHLKGRE